MSILDRGLVVLLTCFIVLPAYAGAPQAGIAGVADRKATVNFTDLALREALAPPVPKAPRRIHAPMPVPRGPAPGVLPLRDSSAAAVPTEARLAPLSPAAASSFLALPDDDTVIPPDTHGAVGPNHLMTVLN